MLRRPPNKFFGQDVGAVAISLVVVAIITTAMMTSSSALESAVKPTRGGVWPAPSEQHNYNFVFQYNPETIIFRLQGNECDIIEEAVDRYKVYLRRLSFGPPSAEFWSKQLPLLSVLLQYYGDCEDLPHFEMNESYTVWILLNEAGQPEAKIIADTVWGILRGLETFSQLSYFNGTRNELLIGGTYVSDTPRFTHRGLLIDSSRHFLPMSTIKTILTGMETNKMNVLHWHIVDDQSFPYQSGVFPQLSEKGAFAPYMIYSASDIEEIVEFARLRGIRVIPEFDTPGHTASWGIGLPGLLTQCNTSTEVTFGPIDPSNENNYVFLAILWQEIKTRFPDTFLHIGGDEVDFSCWQSNPQIQTFLTVLKSSDYADLESYFINRIIRITQDLQLTPIVWQEVFQNDKNRTLDKSALVQIWFGEPSNILSKVTSAGYRALLSSCWYLDQFSADKYAGGCDWKRLYRCEPLAFRGSPEQKRLVVGGEACMWGEYVDHTNIIQRVWPRASATAERLWSHNFSEISAASRLEEHVCRMRIRGVAAQPANGPSCCYI